MTIRVTYDGFDPKEASSPAKLRKQIARDASWGTFIPSLQAAAKTCGIGSEERWRTFEPTVEVLDAGRFVLAFPDGNFNLTEETVDHFVATIAGDIIANGDLSRTLSVEDVELSETFVKALPGPSVGIDGLYDDIFKETLKGVARPLVAFTVKPRTGMSVDDLVLLYDGAAKAGVDLVEDDERLISPTMCRFSERLKRITERREKRQYRTHYSPNITGDTRQALTRLEACIATQMIRAVKIDVLSSGFETLRRVSERAAAATPRIAVTCYPDLTGGQFRGLRRTAILRLARACGADVIYAGSPAWARFDSGTGTIADAVDPVLARHRMLADSTGSNPARTTLATITNDQHPSRIEAVTLAMRKKNHHRYGFFVGGGISAFPADVTIAASIVMQIVERASTESLSQYEAFDLSKYADGLLKIDWKSVDLSQVLDD